MLSKLEFSNFKSWKSAKIVCGKITGIFGANSSGKSSIIQYLLMLKQTKDATDRNITFELNGEYVQLGTMKDLINEHNEEKNIESEIEFELDSPLNLNDPSGRKLPIIASGKRLNLKSKISVRQKAPISTEIKYQLGNRVFSLAPRSTDSAGYDLTTKNVSEATSDFSFLRTQGRAWQLPGPVKAYAFPDQARTYYQNSSFLADLEASYESQLDNIFYLGPLREFPKRDYLWSRSRPADVGLRGEKAIDAILAATDASTMLNLKPKGRKKPFQEVVAGLLEQIGLISSFKVVEIAEGSNRWQAKVITRPGASEVLLTDVGFGISQVLPVITLLQYVPEGSTVILEQPEIHLHPLAQAGLADVIIQAAKHRNVQVIIESHSEHFLLRLQRRMAEGTILAEDVKLYFCDAPEGVSKLTELEIDLFGTINNWPSKFMGDAFTETAEAEIARLKRMADME